MMLPRRSILIGGAAVLGGCSKFAEAPGKAKANRPARAHGFGWMRDLPDPNDKLLGGPPINTALVAPPKVDWSGKLPPAYSQGDLNSCTANAIAGAVQFARIQNNKPNNFIPSRLFIYYQERKAEQNLYTDVGARLRDGITSVAQMGVCPEQEWPYDGVAGDPVTGVFPPNAGAIRTPTEDILKSAAKYTAISYKPLSQNQQILESCLAQGFPFVFGFTVYSNLALTTKQLMKPGPHDSITPEGHAVLVVGYDRDRRMFRIRNSWGPGANDHGHFDMDYDYVLDTDLCADFWVIYQTLGLYMDNV